MEYFLRFVVGYFFDCGVVINVLWICNYVVGDFNIVFVLVDFRKRCGVG